MDTLQALAADPERAYAGARHAHHRVRKDHLWDHRVATIIAAGEAVRAPSA